ncbi:MAG: hypothetical protein DKINENOH_00243 [bacterium]|nr:hypothetical protein [bacterium]MCK6559958.1 hypothetical protein [bacterium]NUM67735.1 hypothetical protein [candidate division KSB1 bacterium]
MAIHLKKYFNRGDFEGQSHNPDEPGPKKKKRTQRRRDAKFPQRFRFFFER